MAHVNTGWGALPLAESADRSARARSRIEPAGGGRPTGSDPSHLPGGLGHPSESRCHRARQGTYKGVSPVSCAKISAILNSISANLSS